jgi:putative drug exporter of the RND superfamily
MTDPFARLGLAMDRHRWKVLAIWIVLLVAAGIIGPKANDKVLGGGFSVPGSGSTIAAQTLETEFNADTRKIATAVFHSSSMTIDDGVYRAMVVAATNRMKAVSGVRVIYTFFNTGIDTLVSKDRHTTLAVVSAKPQAGEIQYAIPKLRDALKGLALDHAITGYSAINYDTFVASEDDLKSSELFTIPIVLILLLIIFRTVVSAIVPLFLAAFCVVLAMAGIYILALITDTSVFALNIASIIGLGLSIDYALIIVTRFREERSAGHAKADAIAITMATAGRSIAYSGITVILSMLILTVLVLPLMIVRSISIGVLMVVVIGVCAGMTLLPAVLSILGDRIELLRIVRAPKPLRPGEVNFWYRLSKRIMRRPWLWLIGALVVLGVLASPIHDLAMGGGGPGILPAATESIRGIHDLDAAGIGGNSLTPIQVVIKTNTKNGVWTPKFLTALQHLSTLMAADPRVSEVRSLYTVAVDAGLPPDQFASFTLPAVAIDPVRARTAAQFVNLARTNDTAVISIVSKYDQFNSRHEGLVNDLRHTIIPHDPQLSGYTVTVGGDSAAFVDFRDALYGRFPIIVLSITILIFIILMMFFQSVFLPLKAMLMNLASLIATYGVLVAIFQYGWGSGILRFEPQGLLNVVTPAILFVILFSLSTDYEVFLLSRIKESYHRTNNNEEAVAQGLQQTAGLITAAGLILVGTFGSFAIARAVPLKEIGMGLAIGILIDTTIVRVIMVPATMRLMGSGNWWMPGWLKKIVPELREGPAPEVPPAVPMAGGVKKN